jgi:hypothetical protein
MWCDDEYDTAKFDNIKGIGTTRNVWYYISQRTSNLSITSAPLCSSSRLFTSITQLIHHRNIPANTIYPELHIYTTTSSYHLRFYLHNLVSKCPPHSAHPSSEPLSKHRIEHHFVSLNVNSHVKAPQYLASQAHIHIHLYQVLLQEVYQNEPKLIGED